MNAMKSLLMVTLILAAGTCFALTGCSDKPDEQVQETAQEEQVEHTAVVTDKLEPYECGSITRLHTYEGVFLASQPAEEDFEQAKKGGVVTVINLRHPEETEDFDEEQVVEDLDLAYHNPAWNGPDELTDTVFDEVRDLLKTAERPILLHCSSGNRVGAMWLAYRVLDEDLDVEEAVAEAKIVGMKTPAYEAKARDYIERHKAGTNNAGSTPDEDLSLDAAARDALLAALDDERRAEAFYIAVINTLGEVRPFTNIVNAEQRHQDLLLPLLESYGIAEPPNPHDPADFDVPATRAEACALGATSERDNIALYDRLIPTIQQQDIKSAFQILRSASADHHLPAFERCAGR